MYKETQKEMIQLQNQLNNITIKTELHGSHQQTKIKLMEDALNNRNQDIELAEDNN